MSFPFGVARWCGMPAARYRCRIVQAEQPMSLAASWIESGGPKGSAKVPDAASSGYGQCFGQLCPGSLAAEANKCADFARRGKRDSRRRREAWTDSEDLISPSSARRPVFASEGHRWTSETSQGSDSMPTTELQVRSPGPPTRRSHLGSWQAHGARGVRPRSKR